MIGQRQRQRQYRLQRHDRVTTHAKEDRYMRGLRGLDRYMRGQGLETVHRLETGQLNAFISQQETKRIDSMCFDK